MSHRKIQESGALGRLIQTKRRHRLGRVARAKKYAKNHPVAAKMQSFKRLSHHKLTNAEKNFMLLLLVAMSACITTAEKIQTNKQQPGPSKASKLESKESSKTSKSGEKTGKSSSSEIMKVINKACNGSDPGTIKTSNKLFGVEIGADDGDLVLQSCLMKNDLKCVDEKYRVDNEPMSDAHAEAKIVASRERQQRQFDLWKLNQKVIKDNLIKELKLSSIQERQFEKEFSKISSHVDAYRVRQFAEKIGAGRCDEHAKIVVDKIREAAFANPGMPVPRVQTVVVEAESNHIFVVLDGVGPDVKIENNPTKVNSFFRTLAGKICDSWNLDRVTKVTKNQNGFYKEGAGWHTVETMDVTPIYNFEGLPTRAINFLKGIITSELPTATAPVVEASVDKKIKRRTS